MLLFFGAAGSSERMRRGEVLKFLDILLFEQLFYRK